MIGLDTNVLVRILTADDPVQTPQAVSFLQKHCSPDAPGFVNCIALTELVWVLQKIYAYTRAEIALAFEMLLANDNLAIEAHEEVAAAVVAYKRANCDLTDALIARINLARGCEATATFDRKAASLEGFVRVP
jgi:predicted nucleic-acid-binding protein